jgi:HEAT repeat protein
VRICSQNLKSFRSSVKSRVALAMLVLMIATVFVYGQDDKKPDSRKDVVAAADIAVKTFSQAKNLIAANNWTAAAEKLNLILTEHPNSKYYEPAIYWLAYVRKQQEKYQEALLLINKFINEFPQSTWKEDARSLRAELAAQVGNTEIINEELQNADNEEVKLAALSSLLRLDPEKGLRQATDILNSKSNIGDRNLREGTINLIGKYGGKEAAAVLLDVAQKETEQEEIRTAAIFALKRHINENVLAQLVELVMKGDGAAVVEAALFIFLEQGNQRAKELLVKIAATAQLTDTRKRAIYFLGRLKAGAAVDELVDLYDSNADIEVKRAILYTLSKTGNPSAQARVFEISRLTDNTGLREEGILLLGRYGDEQIINRIIQLYDTETRYEVKALILSSLSKSKQKNALEKLTNAAQNEKSLQLRKKAIQLLKQRTTNSETEKDN